MNNHKIAYLSETIIYMVFTVLYLLGLDSIDLYIFFFTMIVAINVLLSRLDITNPRFLFTVGFWFYTFSVYFQYKYGYRLYETYEISRMLFLHATFIYAYNISITNIPIHFKYNFKKNLTFLKKLNYIIMIFSFLMTLVYVSYILNSGLLSKTDLIQNLGRINLLKNFYNLLNVSILVHLYISKDNVKDKLPSKFIILMLFMILWFTFVIFISGERDIILRFVLSLMLFYSIFIRKIKPIYVVMIGAIMITSLMMFGFMKSVVLSGVTHFEDINIFYQVFSNDEFLSAPRNLIKVLNNQDSWSFLYGKSFIDDILISIGIDRVSLQTWYNNTFFYEQVLRGKGYGFSIVAEGYMNYGFIGVVFVGAMYGRLISYFYKRGSLSIFYLIIYVLMIPLMIYTIRADLSNLFRQMLTQIVLVVFIYWLLYKFFVRKEKVNE